MSNADDSFAIDKKQLVDFTTEYYDKIYLPAHNCVSHKGFIKCFFLIPVKLIGMFFESAANNQHDSVRKEASKQGRYDVINKLDENQARAQNAFNSVSSFEKKIDQ